MKIRTLVFLFVIALLVGFIVKVPVALFIKDGRLGSVMVYGAEGTIWSGRATAIQVRTERIESASWSINPLYLLIGKAKAHLGFSYLDGRGQGDVSISVGKNLNLSDFQYSVPADQFTQKFANGFVGLEGDVSFQVDNLDYQVGEHFVKNATGYVNWQKSGVAYPISGAFGNAFIDIAQDEETRVLKAEVSNQGGEVSVDGQATLNEDLSYQVDVVLKPTKNMTEALAGNLQAAMPKNADGTYRFQRNGRL